MTIRDDLIKHQIFLQRLGATQAKIMYRHLLINKGHIVDSVVKKTNKDILKLLLRQQNRILVNDSIKHLNDTAVYEASFIARRLKVNKLVTETTTPPEEVLTDAVIKTTMGIKSGARGKNVQLAITQFANRKTSQMLQLVSDDELQKKDDNKTIEKLALMASGLILTQAMSLGVTSINHTANVARDVTYKENDIPRVTWVAILDSSVCEDCASLDNNVWDIGDNEIPPEHWNCRCHLEPIV